MSDASEPTHRPTVPGSVAAVVAGIVAVAVVIDAADQWEALLVVVAGLALCGGGYGAWHRERRLGGALTVAIGGVLVALGLGVAASGPSVMTQRLELLPGLLGLVVLVAGLVPVRAGWERALVTTGAALLFVGVVTSGVVRGASRPALLVAGIASVLAWDLGEQAISLGGQVGRGARTRRAELVHGGGTLVAGAGILVAALGVTGLGIRGLSLTGFAVLLVAGFALVVALRH